MSRPKKISPGVPILAYLTEKGEASVYEVWHDVFRPRGVKYYTVVRYFHMLRELGLVEEVGRRVNSKGSPIKEVLYRIAEGREDDACWFNIKTCYLRKKGLEHLLPQTERILGQISGR